MDKKLGFLVAISAITMIMTSGCSSFRGSGQGAYGADDYGSGSSQISRTGQVSGSSQVDNSNGGGSRRGFFSQQRAPAPATCKPCASSSKPQNTYTYKPAPKPKTTYRPPAKTVYRAPARQAGQHSQQWYIDRWKRQQQQQQYRKPAPRPRSNVSTYSGYGSGGYDAGSNSSSTYYDYSSASGSNTSKPAVTSSTATSNKSIYTGSYQQKTYKPYNPKTYTGGSSATTYSSSTTTTSSGGSGSSTYTVKKGDTVFEIMRQTGVYWKDIIRINGLTPPYNINPGQIIRLK